MPRPIKQVAAALFLSVATSAAAGEGQEPRLPGEDGVAGFRGLCRFDPRALSFAGSPAEQARCLLRPVQKWGKVGPPLVRLPAPLDRLPGTKVAFGKIAFGRYLKARNVGERALGGRRSAALSRAHDNRPDAPDARYFVIHGTSFPNYRDRPFPPTIDDLRWPPNDLGMWDRGERSVAHVFINRVGESLAALSFGAAWRATKLEIQVVGLPAKGLFLHIELIQPRRSDPAGPAGNDALAPAPGFTPAQYERLAMIYAAASVRAGRWLIPAYHAVIDAGLPDGHDDPQNFDLDAWAAALGALLNLMEEVYTDAQAH